MEMHEIRYFLAAGRTLNFHRAADASHVTQPALSRAIQKLERELGGPLFLREKNRVQLTDFGRLMRVRLEEVLASSEQARQSARRFLRLESAPLKLGVMCTIGPLRFVGFLTAFRDRYPGVEVTVTEAPAGRLVEMLLGGEIDLALAAQPETFDGRLSATTIYAERFGVAFPAGHRFETLNMLRLADIEGEAYLDRINCEYGSHFDRLCAALGFTIRCAYQSEREDWIMAMVAGGMGVCLAPEFSVGHPGVCHRPIAEPEVVREVSLVSVADRSLSPAIAAFASAVGEYRWSAAAT